MILVDTSVWIDHLRRSEPRLVELLSRDEVLCHTLVVQELALGSIKDRDALLSALVELRATPLLTQAELLTMVDTHRLWGRGLSAVDCQLLGSVLLTAGASLWTRDRQLRAAAEDLGIATMS